MSVQIKFITKTLEALLPPSTLKKFRGILTRKRNIHTFNSSIISTPEKWNMLKFSNDLTKGVRSQCQTGATEAQQIQGVYVQVNNPSCILYRFHFWEGGTLRSHLSLHGIS